MERHRINVIREQIRWTLCLYKLRKWRIEDLMSKREKILGSDSYIRYPVTLFPVMYGDGYV